jgi:hypothetical protein
MDSHFTEVVNSADLKMRPDITSKSNDYLCQTAEPPLVHDLLSSFSAGECEFMRKIRIDFGMAKLSPFYKTMIGIAALGCSLRPCNGEAADLKVLLILEKLKLAGSSK